MACKLLWQKYYFVAHVAGEKNIKIEKREKIMKAKGLRVNTFHIILATAFLMTITLVANTSASDDFPLRAEYQDVEVMSTDELAANFDNTLIVDVRSGMEYDVAHINKAVNVSISKATFTKDLEAVRAKDDPTPLAFYCNGHTCSKSYKAAKKAAADGFNNVYAYDAGIFDWIISQPDKATLMGKTPASKDKIISKSELKKRMLAYTDFLAKAGSDNAVNIDIRDPFQRKDIPDVPKLRNIPLDRLTKLLQEKKFQGQQLLFLDAVGKQVRWLQYHLEENGYDNYYFLEKGVAGIK